MKKVAIYCQHLLGVGHLTRCLALARGLLENFEVHFIQGGEDIGRRLEHPRMNHHFLSPITMNESDSSLFSAKGLDLSECWSLREKQLSDLSTQGFDAVIVELYPFGRKKMSREILPWLEGLKEKNHSLPVICSLRDILVEKEGWEKRQDKIIQIVKDSFDWVLVHSDPRVVPLEMTFSKAPSFQEKIVYTGYVTEGVAVEKSSRRDGILVSLGGGIVGEELVELCLKIAPTRPDLSWSFIKSPNMKPVLKDRLNQISEPNIKVLDFSPHYEQLLCQHQLSISMGGYNTVMNLINTKTFGLVYPYQKSSEQLLRTRLLHEKGVLTELRPETLNEASLLACIDSAIDKSDWDQEVVNLEGVSFTNQWLMNRVYEIN